MAAVLLLSAALLLLVVNVVRFSSDSDLALRWLAASERMQLTVLRWELHSTVVVGVMLGTGYGLLITNAGRPAQITQVNQWPQALAAVAVGILISIVVEAGIVAVVRSMRAPAPPRSRTTAESPQPEAMV